ncbi:hypothetical protein CPHO_05670 [Corynebacterium phocae]|uniref:YbjN domain-containing protein n=1 Tax=Corynebacterium phocae TaxID=161895 RepID=A0A1L7D2R3_9CORY|nr:YbjN domain-containing protein [Corynebacterium phocae]APT92456.1 hypothetical protein CPHO_05670 [Corynebacterium phocae]KAA8725060.1 YbjN domain-containing protein [Corynebacterium phocae]
MTTPEPQILPDTPVIDVKIDRIEEILTEQGLKYRIEDAPAPAPNGEDKEGEQSAETTVKVLRTGFINTAIAMQVRGDVLVIDSIWRGRIPSSEGPQVLQLINEWNSQHFAPTLRFFESPEQTLAISAVRELNVADGASRNQLGAFVMASLNALLEAFAFVEQKYPQLITWQEPHND